MVPGGQAVYVSSDGSIHYTQAHSSSMPQESYRGGFHNITVSTSDQKDQIRNNCNDGDSASGVARNVSIVTFTTPDGSNIGGLLLCPDVPDYMEEAGATYQLYARTPSFNKIMCTEIEGLLERGSTEDYGAWQYT